MKKFSFVMLLFLLTTCTKFGENIHVTGRVINPATGKGIPGVEIALQKKTTFEYATGYKEVKMVISDGNGEFEIRHLAGFKQYYLNCMYSTSYYPIGWYVNGEFKDSYITKIRKGKKNEVEFQMLPYGNFRETINNVNCFDETDFLYVNRSHQFDETGYSGQSDYNGCFTFIGTTYVQFPMGWMYYTGYYLKNGIRTDFKDSLFIEEGMNNEWIFEY